MAAKPLLDKEDARGAIRGPKGLMRIPSEKGRR